MHMNGEGNSDADRKEEVRPLVLMLLTNCYDPDPRVRQEALALLKIGCQVRILAWDRDLKTQPKECVEGVEVERVFLGSKHGRGNLQTFFYAWLYVKMFWRAVRTPFDVIHCHDLDTLPIGFILGKLKRKPIVYDAHESFTDMLEGSVHPWLRRALVALEKFLIRRINLLITVGEKLRRHFEERGSRHSVVVGNWKGLEEFSRTDAENRDIRKRLGIPEGAFVATCITQLLKDRKIEELLDAVDSLADWYVIIGGKGVLEGLVRQRAANNPRIIFVGYAGGRDIASYTCTADVIYYGFDPANPNARFSAPNKLFEALAAGKPLITGDFGEIADVVRSASCGFVLPEYSAEAIRDALALLNESNLRDTVAQNARRFGKATMNWRQGETILHAEYSALLPNRLSPAVPRELTSVTSAGNAAVKSGAAIEMGAHR